MLCVWLLSRCSTLVCFPRCCKGRLVWRVGVMSCTRASSVNTDLCSVSCRFQLFLLTVTYLCLEWRNFLAFPFLQLDRRWPVKVSLFLQLWAVPEGSLNFILTLYDRWNCMPHILYATFLFTELGLVEHSFVISINLMLSYLLECRFGHSILQCSCEYVVSAEVSTSMEGPVNDISDNSQSCWHYFTL